MIISRFDRPHSSVLVANELVRGRTTSSLVLTLRCLVVLSAVCVKGQAVSSDVPCNLHAVSEASLHPVPFTAPHGDELGLFKRAQVANQILQPGCVGQGPVSSVVLKREAVVGAFDDADQEPATSLSVRADLLLLRSSLRDLGCLATSDHPMSDLLAGGHVVCPLAGHGPYVVQEGASNDADIVDPSVNILRGRQPVVLTSFPLAFLEANGNQLLDLALVGRLVACCALIVDPHGLFEDVAHCPRHLTGDIEQGDEGFAALRQL